MSPTSPWSSLQSRLVAQGFELEPHGGGLRARRRRLAPARGLFRLLIPRVVCDLAARPDGTLSRRVRPDGLALGVLLVCAAGVAIELLLDRARYPREYPPEFIYGLAAAQAALLTLELWTSTRALARALD